jgi:hypothetical protein
LGELIMSKFDPRSIPTLWLKIENAAFDRMTARQKPKKYSIIKVGEYMLARRFRPANQDYVRRAQIQIELSKRIAGKGLN